MSRGILYKKQMKMIPILSQGLLTYKQKLSSKSGIPDLEKNNLSKTVFPDLKRIYNLIGGCNGNT